MVCTISTERKKEKGEKLCVVLLQRRDIDDEKLDRETFMAGL